MTQLLNPGDILFGRFEVIQPLGQGAQGETAEGLDRETGRNVCIKARKSSCTKARAKERFLREGQFQSNDPHLANPIFADEDYIVFPLLPAQNLADLLADGWIPSKEDTLIITVRGLEALATLHPKGIIHRDIKPGNILFNPQTKVTVLIDLGVAHFRHLSRITQLGDRLATTLYASPEHLTDARTVDERSDLYALGVLMYFLLTGTDAFLAPSNEAITQRVLHDTPQPIEKLNPRAPKLLVSTAMRLMEKNPSDRFANAQEVLAHLTGRPSSPAHSSSTSIDARCLACGSIGGESACSGCGKPWSGFFLQAFTPDMRTRRYQLPLGSHIIGRSHLGNQRHVSSEHCRIEVSPHEVQVEDLQSLNGTRINQNPANYLTTVRESDILEIADITLFLEATH